MNDCHGMAHTPKLHLQLTSSCCGYTRKLEKLFTSKLKCINENVIFSLSLSLAVSLHPSALCLSLQQSTCPTPMVVSVWLCHSHNVISCIEDIRRGALHCHCRRRRRRWRVSALFATVKHFHNFHSMKLKITRKFAY